MYAIKLLSILLFLVFRFAPLVNAQELFVYTIFNKNTFSIGNQEDTFLLPKDMVLKIIPSVEKNSLPFVFLISGDGGWTKFDQLLAEALAKKGLGVIGLNAKKYFWNAKTPETTTSDVSAVIEHYQNLWNKKPFVLIGYSFGADVIPFIANRLNDPLKGSLKGVLALSPDRYSDFEIAIANLFHLKKSTKYDVLVEFKKINPIKAFAFFGSKEDINLRNHFIDQGIKTILLTGNHHFNYEYELISTSLFKAITEK